MNKLLKSFIAIIVFLVVTVNTVNVHGEEAGKVGPNPPIVSSKNPDAFNALLDELYANEAIAISKWNIMYATEQLVKQYEGMLSDAEAALNWAKTANDFTHNAELKEMVEQQIKIWEKELEEAIIEGLDESII